MRTDVAITEGVFTTDCRRCQ